MSTRRWFYYAAASGRQFALVSAVERHRLDALPGEHIVYRSADEMAAGLQKILANVRRVAMEYSPECAIPYVSRVDAGTIELVRRMGVNVVSSGDLIQRFGTVWDAAAIATHREASEKLYRVKDRAFEAIARRTRDKVPT